jgi:acetyl esterase/lipase
VHGPLYDATLDAFVDECRRFNTRLAALSTAPVDLHTPEGLAHARDLANIAGGVFATRAHDDKAEVRTVPGRAGAIPIRVLVPPMPRALYLDLHGGGFFMGDARMNDALNWRIAEAAGAVTVAVDYRLAPEHPYPAAPDDCEAVARWVIEHAQAEWGVDRFLIGGGSAGGNLVAVTLLRLRDRHGITGKFAGANLLFGVYDLRGTASQIRLGQTGFRDLYVPDVPIGERIDPDISPMYADLRDMPPALFTVGTLDYLYDDSLLFATRWWAAGNETELAVYPECPHGFTVFPTTMAKVASQRIVDWLAART